MSLAPLAARLCATLVLIGLGGWGAAARVRAPIQVLASRAVYADIARQIAGDDARVRMRASLSAAAPCLVVVAGEAEESRLDAAAFASRRSPGDPFYWFEPDAMMKLAQALAARLAQSDPAHAAAYSANLTRFDEALDHIQSQMRDLATLYRGSDVFVLNEAPRRLIQKLNFRIENPDSDGAPLAQSEANRLRTAIAERDASILAYDQDASSMEADSLVALAKDSDVPVVAFRQDLPKALSYQAWMTRLINAIRGALNEAAP